MQRTDAVPATENAFQCPFCNQAYANGYFLYRHLETHRTAAVQLWRVGMGLDHLEFHEDGIIGPLGPYKLYFCPLCGSYDYSAQKLALGELHGDCSGLGRWLIENVPDRRRQRASSLGYMTFASQRSTGRSTLMHPAATGEDHERIIHPSPVLSGGFVESLEAADVALGSRAAAATHTNGHTHAHANQHHPLRTTHYVPSSSSSSNAVAVPVATNSTAVAGPRTVIMQAAAAVSEPCRQPPSEHQPDSHKPQPAAAATTTTPSPPDESGMYNEENVAASLECLRNSVATVPVAAAVGNPSESPAFSGYTAPRDANVYYKMMTEDARRLLFRPSYPIVAGGEHGGRQVVQLAHSHTQPHDGREVPGMFRSGPHARVGEYDAPVVVASTSLPGGSAQYLPFVMSSSGGGAANDYPHSQIGQAHRLLSGYYPASALELGTGNHYVPAVTQQLYRGREATALPAGKRFRTAEWNAHPDPRGRQWYDDGGDAAGDGGSDDTGDSQDGGNEALETSAEMPRKRRGRRKKRSPTRAFVTKTVIYRVDEDLLWIKKDWDREVIRHGPQSTKAKTLFENMQTALRGAIAFAERDADQRNLLRFQQMLEEVENEYHPEKAAARLMDPSRTRRPVKSKNLDG